MTEYFRDNWFLVAFTVQYALIVIWFIIVLKRSSDLNTYLTANKLDGALTISNQNVMMLALIQIAKSGVMMLASLICLWPYSILPTKFITLVSACAIIGCLMVLQSWLASRANDKLGEQKPVEVEATISLMKMDEGTADRAKQARSEHALENPIAIEPPASHNRRVDDDK